MHKSHLAWKRLYQTALCGQNTRAVRTGSPLGDWSIVGGGHVHGNGKTAMEAWRNACERHFGDHHLQAFRQGSYIPY